MKRIFLFLLVCTLASLAGYAQQYPITGITISLPSNPPANIANWGTGASTIVITAQTRLVQAQIDGHVAESQVLVTIEKGGSKVCGSYTSATAPMSGFSSAVKTYAGSNAMTLLAQDCSLPPGDYQLCVQFFGNDSTGGFGAFSEKKCKLFSIRGNEQPPEVLKYTGPTLVSPVNGTVFKCEDLKKPLSLRWTPVVPPPPVNDVVYTIRIYEVYNNQQPAQAVNANLPVLEKEVRITQTIWQIPNEYITLQENKSFVWSIQATNREGKGYGENDGKSELWSFMMNCEKKIQDPPINKPKITDKKDSIKSKEDSFSCKKFKVDFKRIPNGDSILFKIKILNNYKGNDLSYKPKSFKIRIKNDLVIGMIDRKETILSRTPQKIPPHTNSVIWVDNTGDIPNGETILGTLHFGKPTANPVYIIYEWLNKDEKVICKDSIAFRESKFYYSIGSDYSGEIVEARDTLFLQVENNYSTGSNKLTYTIKNLSNNKTSSSIKLDIKNNQGLIRIALPIQNSIVGKGEIGVLTLWDYKKYYYINFKRINNKVINEREK